MLKKWVVSTKDGVLSGISNVFNKVIDSIKKGVKVTSKYAKIIATFVIIKPALMISNGIKKIPTLYKEYISRLKSFVKNEIEGFKIGFEEGSGRPWDRSKGFINTPKPPIEKPAQAEVKVNNPEEIHTENLSMRYIMTFESFKY